MHRGGLEGIASHNCEFSNIIVFMHLHIYYTNCAINNMHDHHSFDRVRAYHQEWCSSGLMIFLNVKIHLLWSFRAHFQQIAYSQVKFSFTIQSFDMAAFSHWMICAELAGEACWNIGKFSSLSKYLKIKLAKCHELVEKSAKNHSKVISVIYYYTLYTLKTKNTVSAFQI